MKHRFKQTQRRARGRWILAFIAAPVLAGLLQAETPKPLRPTRLGGTPEQMDQHQATPRSHPYSSTPFDIEKSLGSIAGSYAGAPGEADRYSVMEASQVRDTKTVDTHSASGMTVSSEAEVRIDAAVSKEFETRKELGTPMEDAGPSAGNPLLRSSAHINIPAPISHGPYRGQLDAYRTRAMQIDDSVRDQAEFRNGSVDFTMWWQDELSKPLGFATQSMPINVGGLTEMALVSSPYVQGILTEPEIRRSDLVIADAEFDSLAFVEAKFADTNEPVGSALTTGDNSNRFRDETFSSAAGLRKKSRYGGSLEMVQRGGYQDNNSTFLVPNPQGTTRLEINFTQPLLKDHGRAVNNTRVLLAKIDVQLANSEVREDLEDHLIDVTGAYWELFQARAEWLQRNRLLEGAAVLHDILQARGEVDSLQRQVLRARAAVTSRRSDLVRAETRIRNAQARLRLLTGDARLLQASRWELTPQDRPLAFPVDLSAREATITALDNRPDVAQAIRKIQAVSARVGAAKNQVLPRLDLILSTYVAGLENKTDVFGAWANQFSDGRPSYAAGLQFEIPVGNRASRARLNRNRWELTRSLFEFEQTTEIAFTDVEVAVRETHTAFAEMVTKKEAIDAATREVSYLKQRWELLPDPNESAVLLIEDLLDAQERLADEERAFVRAQVDYAMSWVQLRKAMGVLLQLENPCHSPLIAAEPAPLETARGATQR